MTTQKSLLIKSSGVTLVMMVFVSIIESEIHIGIRIQIHECENQKLMTK